ncbi:phospholipid/cholesterol/gamma-HCH transport system ATP-binding protein [Panacagrimonas perspica]|uniref:Phospholipid/cholesterol/gamma-HCH transport system ATP-binding protein n=1 Tax=Panacagrimonas perspica TaxID=381431 RepID=A0A4S3K663_9GAMM|nr:ABC transporter ATP-binding protein [Panacagrimonas perspica]TDU26831.1 phospholipid/cholesterol/gamma-HCH transport system ATP-binding protein [Panacagrimonas perspica]THD03606.1 phospholipid ABC transporter ATP-binding protein MlaF [Panacagrimonas perspica]
MNANDAVLVRARGVHFAHGTRVIYDGVDIEIPRGKVVAIMGPSGTGKTTLLRLIGGQWRPKAGTVEFDGIDVHQLGRGPLYELRKRMGMLFQNGALLTDLTVFENVAFPLREQTKLPESMIRDLVLMKLQAVGLRGARDMYPQQLSGGMSRRVALARAIALDPDLVMYDEPFAGQDPISMGVLMRLIRTLNDALGLTSIVVSHDLQEVLSIADYGYLIADGKVQAQGTADVIRESQHPWVQQFLRGLPDGPVAFHYKAPDFASELLGTTKAGSP